MHSNIVRCAIQSVWNRAPNLFQAEVIPLILQMFSNDKIPEPILLVQPSDSGKMSSKDHTIIGNIEGPSM